MPLYNYKCDKCNHKYEKLVKMSQEYDKCPLCFSITKRTHCDLPNPAQIEVGVGGVYKGKFQERNFQ